LSWNARGAAGTAVRTTATRLTILSDGRCPRRPPFSETMRSEERLGIGKESETKRLELTSRTMIESLTMFCRTGFAEMKVL
jgi:hypothetical protein